MVFCRGCYRADTEEERRNAAATTAAAGNATANSTGSPVSQPF